MTQIVNDPETMTLVATASQLVPLISADPLPDPTHNLADAVVVSGEVTLTYSCVISIPVEVELSEVSALQYYKGNRSTELEIYFVYDYCDEMSGDYNEYHVQVEALYKDAESKAIPLATIQTIFTLIENIDPKTSRGTVTTVRLSDPQL